MLMVLASFLICLCGTVAHPDSGRCSPPWTRTADRRGVRRNPRGAVGDPGPNDVVHEKCVQFLGPCQVLTTTKTVCTLVACGRRSVDVQPRCPGDQNFE